MNFFFIVIIVLIVILLSLIIFLCYGEPRCVVSFLVKGVLLFLFLFVYTPLCLSCLSVSFLFFSSTAGVRDLDLESLSCPPWFCMDGILRTIYLSLHCMWILGVPRE